MSPREDPKKSSHHHADDEDDDSKIFPMRLHEILNDEAHADAICWLPHGKAFVIRDRRIFAETVMPKFFSRKAKYSSFTRKLNRWNFTRVSSGPELGAYYHQYFLRDKPHLAAQMFCKNARTKLAMANDTPEPAAAIKAAPETQTAAAAATIQQESAPVGQNYQNIPLGLLAAISKEPAQNQTRQESRKFDFTGSSLQLLERQLQLLQEEQAQRLAMYRLAMANQTLPNMAPPQPQQAAGIQQMQQLMQMRERQRKGLVPRNGRASAA